jgi:hypothetical protein
VRLNDVDEMVSPVSNEVDGGFRVGLGESVPTSRLAHVLNEEVGDRSNPTELFSKVHICGYNVQKAMAIPSRVYTARHAEAIS